MVFSLGGSPLSAVATTEEEDDEVDRSRKIVRKDGEKFSGEVLLKPRVEDWMDDETPKTRQPEYKESLLKNMLPSWCDLDEEGTGK